MQLRQILPGSRLALLLALAAAPPLAAQAPGAMPAMPVETATVQARAIQDSLVLTGSLLARESVMVRPEMEGRVQALHFTEGAPVAAGAVLVTLDDAELKARVAEAAAQLKLAQHSHVRVSATASKHLSSRQELDQATAQLEAARAGLAVAQEQLAKTRLTAPFAGVTGLRRVSPGAYVKAGDDLVNLEDIAVLRADFRVPEKYLAHLRPGLQLRVEADASPGQSFPGTVTAVDPRIDAASRSVPVRAEVQNPEARLRPGQFVRLGLTLAERPQALVVPEAALWPVGGKTFVYRVREGKVELAPVSTGARQPGLVEITAGLTAGDEVVVAGMQKIRPGAAVKALPAAAPAQP
jgi:membrane fusion protein (multidrug efflux system)